MILFIYRLLKNSGVFLLKDIRRHYKNTDIREQQQTYIVDIPEDKNVWKQPLYMFLDQASHTGYSVFDDDSKLVMSGVMYHEESVENKKTYIHTMVEVVTEICLEYGVKHLFHEEVYIDGERVAMSTAESLHYIKSHIQDIGHFHPEISVYGLDIRKWKSELAKPNRYKFSKKNGSKKDNEEKAETMKHVSEIFPLVSLVTDDESDAIGMGIAVMIKNKNKRNIYNVTRYNKKLPIYLEIFNKDFDFTNDDAIEKLKVKWKRPANIGGVYKLPLNRARNVEIDIRQFLSHKDALIYFEIPKDYKNWGFILLENNYKLDDITSDDKSFYLVASRKNRM